MKTGLRLQLQAAANSYRVLGLERTPNLTRSEVKRAFYRKMKILHPDINKDRDATKIATELNAAYDEVLMDLIHLPFADEEDVFDFPEGPPLVLFINPFACYNVNPMEWEALQDMCKAAEGAEKALEILYRAGVRCSENAAVYVSALQHETLISELRNTMNEDITSIQVTENFISNCLNRAQQSYKKRY
jgi:DnaJ domain